MSIGNNASAFGAQMEYVRKELPRLSLEASVLLNRIKVRTDVQPVSTRPARIPLQPLTQGGMKVNSFNGADMGLGSAPVETFGSLTCVPLLQASQWTFEADWANDQDTKSIQNFVTLTMKQAPKCFAGFRDALLANSDGSNTLGSVVSTTTNGLVVQNANAFQDQQNVDLWDTLGGTFLGTVTIQSTDIGNNTIWLTGAVPGGVGAGTLILAEGSSGQANSGINGPFYYYSASNVGNFMGIPRSSFPGKLTTPTVDRAGGAMTPASVRAVFANIQLRLGAEAADADLVAHGNVDAQMAWENVNLAVNTAIMNQQTGDKSLDMLKRNGPSAIAGREFLVNPRARPGTIHFLPLAKWWRIETRKADYISVAGQTSFPAYGLSGGIASSVLTYLATIEQYGTSEPGLGGVYSDFAAPTGVFGA